MSAVGCTLLLCLILLATSSGGATGSQQINYVTPTSHAGTPCPEQPCLTLDEYIANSSIYITSNTVFKLLSGRHDIASSFVARNIECLTIKGDTSQVKINGVGSHLLQLINTVNVYIAEIELDDVGISLDHTENVTLHQLVVDGPRTAVSGTNTIDTIVSCCTLKNTGWTALTLRNTYNTSIFNSSVNNTRWNGFDFYNTTKTDIMHSFINHTGWNGIEIQYANSTVISSSTVNSTGWNGIDVFNSSQTVTINTFVKNTRWNGIEIQYANSTVISSSTVNSTRWNGIEVFNSSQTVTINTFVKNTRWNGIEVQRATNTVIACSTVKSTGSNGIEVYRSVQTTVTCTHVNRTRQSGIEIYRGSKLRLIGTNITNTRRRTLDCRYTDEPCAIEMPQNLSCSCYEDICNAIPLNYFPLTVTVTDVTSSTISVQWKSVSCIHQNGDITGYSVQYEVMGSGNTQTISVAGATTTQTTISGLTPSTTYFIGVAAVNNQHIGQYSTVENSLTEGMYLFPGTEFTLLPISVAVPVLTVDSTTATSISLSWTSCGSEGVSYEVKWQRDTSIGCSDDDQGSTTTTDTSYTISGLEEDSRYGITMTASNGIGEKKSNSINPVTIKAGEYSKMLWHGIV